MLEQLPRNCISKMVLPCGTEIAFHLESSASKLPVSAKQQMATNFSMEKFLCCADSSVHLHVELMVKKDNHFNGKEVAELDVLGTVLPAPEKPTIAGKE